MDLSLIFGVIAGLLAILAYVFYFRQSAKGLSVPNPSSWAIWFLVGIINTFTFFTVVGENFWQSFIALTVTLCVGIVFFYSLFKGKFSKITSMEIVIFILAVIIGIFWQVTSQDRLANILLQGIYVLSYIPTINGILKGFGREFEASWITAIIAYVFSTLSILLNFNGDYASLLFPMVNGLLGNGTILFLIYYVRRRG